MAGCILEAKGRGDEEINLLISREQSVHTAQIGRTQAFDDAVEAHDNMDELLAQQSGEFTQAKGQEVMESMLKQSGDDN